MKKIMYFVWLMVGLTIMPACQRSNQIEAEAMRQDSINAALQDSINTANAEKDSLMQLMSDIADGMAQIKEMEDIISVNNLNGETPDRKKQIRDDIVSRPDGFGTKLVRGGQNFSGGQRQRIEIATALAKEPAVLIMDEATSALDPKTEDEVMAAIRMMGPTQMIIAHRLSTIRDCDEILVMDQGKILQRGTHEQLIEQEGLYRDLMRSE